MYSPTIVDVVTADTDVAFVLAVMLTPVMFALPDTNAAVKLPLLAAFERSDEKVLLRLAALPAYASRRLSSLVRATTPSSFTSIEKLTSTWLADPAVSTTSSALMDLTSSISDTNEITLISAFLTAFCTSLEKVASVKPPRRSADSRDTSR